MLPNVSQSQTSWTVNFDGTTVSTNPTEIMVSARVNTIIFDLSSTPTVNGTAVFHNPPVRRSARNPSVPSFVSIARVNNKSFVLTDIDKVPANGTNKRFSFQIGVDYTTTGGRTTTIWSQDPTVVNTPVTTP